MAKYKISSSDDIPKKTIQVDYEVWKAIKQLQLDDGADTISDVIRDLVKDRGYL